MSQNLIDRIYECAFAPEFWPDVLDELAAKSEARGGVFFAADLHTGAIKWVSSPKIHDTFADYASGGWITRKCLRNRLFESPHAGFLTEDELYQSPKELAADPTYRDFLRPRGLGWFTGTGISLPTKDLLIITLEREYDRGPVERSIVDQLDALRPHLARAALMSARLRLERAQVAAETLRLVGLPALAFDERGKVIAANGLIEALTNHIRWLARDRIALKDSSADAMLQEAMKTQHIDSATPTRSFVVRSANSGSSMIGHVIPLRRAARDIFAESVGVLLLTPVTQPQAPPVELVRSLFDLTPAEARVARSLSAGETVEAIASFGGVSLNTVRSQVRCVLEKTGCHRQAEVIALLSGIAMPQR
jgi:DNA-binding NarL/FixJ family response regulator